MRRVAVFGMGYVGCVSAACLARDGHQVLGVDIDEQKLESIRAGRSPIAEPGLEELLSEQVAAGRLSTTTDVAEAVRQSDLALIAVGTPSASDGSVRTVAVEGVMRSIGEALKSSDNNYVVVVRSTLLPGILEDQLQPILEEASGRTVGDGLALCNNPEFLRETTAIRDYDDPPFILAGTGDEGVAQVVFDLYPQVAAERLIADTRTTALVKYACNAFHALKIDFANEIGAVSRSFGADGQDVMQIVCRDERLNISPAYLRPGFAFGGSCLPKDVRALTRHAQQAAIKTELLNAIIPSNDAHLERGLRMIRETNCRRIGLVGLSFKAGTDDLRESPPVILAETLLGRGYDLTIYDPGVRLAQLAGTNLAFVDVHLPHLAALLTENAADVYEHADLLVITTNVADSLDWSNDFFGQVIDLRRDLVTATPVGLSSV